MIQATNWDVAWARSAISFSLLPNWANWSPRASEAATIFISLIKSANTLDGKFTGNEGAFDFQACQQDFDWLAFQETPTQHCCWSLLMISAGIFECLQADLESSEYISTPVRISPHWIESLIGFWSYKTN